MRKYASVIIWSLLSCVLAVFEMICVNSFPQPAVTLRPNGAGISYIEIDGASQAHGERTRTALWNRMGSGYAVYSGDWRLLTDGFLLFGQSGVCLISEKYAIEHFGSANVVGCDINVEGKAYSVSGVYKTGIADVIIHKDDIYVEYSNIVLSFPDKPKISWRGEAESVMSAAGIASLDGVSDTAILTSISDGSFLTSLVPTRWADFTTWGNNVAEIYSRLYSLSKEPLTPVEALFLSRFRIWLSLFIMKIVFAIHAALGFARITKGLYKRPPKSPAPL